ncbi:MAG: ABC-2 family transporter protein [Candidatus Marsarchaeota archaeon]|nr:ABC-2 family transporter protein [Candidatus Marsarchaeota archaeon]
MEFIENIKYFMLCQKYHWKEFFTYRLQGLIWIIAGWNYYQLLLLANTSGFIIGFVWYFIIAWNIVDGMRAGELDKYLIRPFGKITCILSGYSGNLTGVAGPIGSLLLIIYSLVNLKLQLLSIVMFIFSMLIGIAAIVMLFLFITVLAYLFMNSAQFTNSMLNISFSANSYPLAIYGIGIQLIFTLILPIGFAVYYPIQALLGVINPIFAIISVFGLFIIIAVSKLGFDKAIRGYSSGGG